MPNSDDRPTTSAFDTFLTALHPDRELAGERYKELCLKLRKFFAWKRCRLADIDELVDETIDRIVKRCGEGEIIENIDGYAGGVAWKVWHEYTRKQIPDSLEDDPADVPIAEMGIAEEDERFACLVKCLARIATRDREMILDYYNAAENEKNKDHRKTVAARYGKSSGALKVQATRLRETLRDCIGKCMGERIM